MKIRLLSFGFFVPSANGFGVLYWNNPTSYNSTPWSCVPPEFSWLQWLKIEDNNTNFTFYWSMDGQNWIQVYQVSRTAWLANPNQIGIFYQTGNAAGIDSQIWQYSWEES